MGHQVGKRDKKADLLVPRKSSLLLLYDWHVCWSAKATLGREEMTIFSSIEDGFYRLFFFHLWRSRTSNVWSVEEICPVALSDDIYHLCHFQLKLVCSALFLLDMARGFSRYFADQIDDYRQMVALSQPCDARTNILCFCTYNYDCCRWSRNPKEEPQS